MADQAMLTELAQSPLAAMADELAAGSVSGARGVRLAERPFATMISVRVAPDSPAAAAIGDVLGTPLPARCGEVAAAGAHSVLWLGPDEWLIVSESPAADLLPALAGRIQGQHAAVVDVSANRTILELDGPSARRVLEKGCPIDLHPRAFGPGRAVTTTLARIPLVLWQTGEHSYRLLPRSSFSAYVATWLLDAMREFATDFRDGGPS